MMQLVWAIEIVTAITAVSSTINFSNLPASTFTAFASLRTVAFEKKIQAQLLDSDVRPLSRSLLAQGRLYTWNQKFSSNTKTWGEQSADQRIKAIHAAVERLETLEQTILDRIIEGKVVIVKKLGYVLVVMISCAFLVVGGIVVSIFMGNRLEGVDPLNITLFAWVLAGFTTLATKSLLVTEWPWWDLLRGRVPCRSISELQIVTGVDPQVVSMKWTKILGIYHRPYKLFR
jgi:hypothetical protein